jgi:nicotinamidase-related amidase
MVAIPAEPDKSTFEPGAGALVIIDMQRDFVHPGGSGAALGNDISLLLKAVAPSFEGAKGCWTTSASRSPTWTARKRSIKPR